MKVVTDLIEASIQGSTPCTDTSIIVSQNQDVAPKTSVSSGQKSKNSRNRDAGRISHACDRCRLKRSKCTGGKICARCKVDGAVCVMTPRTKRQDSLLLRPAYIHMVEAQRDRLVMALEKFLGEEDADVSARLKASLADMGIEVGNLRQSDRHDLEPSGDGLEVETLDDQTLAMTWNAIFSNLDRDELATIFHISELEASPDSVHSAPSIDIDMGSFSESQTRSSPGSMLCGIGV